MRKADMEQAVAVLCALQWGRNLIVAEGYHALARKVELAMLQWGRNLIVAEGRTVPRALSGRACFNGAAT